MNNPGDGKSWLGATTPAPRLIVDAEGGAEFVHGRKVIWRSPNDPPPAMDGVETCIVRIGTTKDLTTVFQWLQRGQHPFVSVTIDSLSELQKRIVDEVAGTQQLSPQDWGSVFRRGEALVRSFRDLIYNPVKPLLCVCYLTGSVERGRAAVSVGPHLQGQLGSTLPGFVDIVGLLQIEDDEDGTEHRRLYVHQQRRHVEVEGGLDGKMRTVDWKVIAKDRTDVFSSGVIDVTFDKATGRWADNIETMMQRITDSLRNREEGEVALD